MRKGNIRYKDFAKIRNIDRWIKNKSIDRESIINIETCENNAITEEYLFRVWYFAI